MADIHLASNEMLGIKDGISWVGVEGIFGGVKVLRGRYRERGIKEPEPISLPPSLYTS
jgi:hypothetical protein